MKGRSILLLILAVVTAIRVRLWNMPLERDEGEYAYAGWLLLHGGIPYEQAFIQKPPMVFYSYLLADRLLPQVSWSPRLLA